MAVPIDALMVRSLDFLVGLRLWRAARRLAQRTHDREARKIDLESIVREAFGCAQQEVCRMPERDRVCRLPAQGGLRRRIAPWLVCDAAERQPRVPDRPALNFERGRDRYEREAIGE